MSLLGKYLKGWRFRTNYPLFESGEELQLFVTDIKDDTLIARVGDSFIHISDGDPALVDTQVRVRVDSFDSDTHIGTATLLEPIDAD